MRNLSVLLVFVVLSLGLVACQTDPMITSVPPDLPTSLPSALPDSFFSAKGPIVSGTVAQASSQNGSLEPQQSLCEYPITFYDYNGCWVYDDTTPDWLLVWPNGYGWTDCYIYSYVLNNWEYVYNDYGVCNV